MDIKNKNVFVTGSTRGIGLAIAHRFASLGANIVLNGRSEISKDLIDSFNDYGVKVIAISGDVSQFDDAKRMVDEAIAELGSVDILVNNAGITRDGMTKKMTDEMWDLVIDVDLKGVFNLTRYVGPQMEAQGAGAIVNISSVVGVFGNIGQANYSAAKAGLLGLTKTWAKEFARKGAAVRVNAIAPGYTMTSILSTVPQDLLDKFAKMTMLGRLGQPDEIAKAALFLVSDDASYVTGQTLNVNGGMRL